MNRFRGPKRERIVRNPNVLKMTECHVVFTEDFKRLALRKRAEGQTPLQIFSEAGFDAKDFKPRYFRLVMKKWISPKTENKSGQVKVETRGRKKTVKNYDTLEGLSAQELKSIILVQEEMLSTLKKMKALPKKR